MVYNNKIYFNIGLKSLFFHFYYKRKVNCHSGSAGASAGYPFSSRQLNKSTDPVVLVHDNEVFLLDKSQQTMTQLDQVTSGNRDSHRCKSKRYFSQRLAVKEEKEGEQEEVSKGADKFS